MLRLRRPQDERSKRTPNSMTKCQTRCSVTAGTGHGGARPRIAMASRYQRLEPAPGQRLNATPLETISSLLWPLNSHVSMIGRISSSGYDDPHGGGTSPGLKFRPAQCSLAQNVVGGHAPGSGRVSSLTDHRVPRAVSGHGGLQAYGELRDRARELRDRYGATCGNFVIADTHLNLREPHRYFDFSTETCSPAHTARPDQALPRVCAGQRPFSLIPSYRVC